MADWVRFLFLRDETDCEGSPSTSPYMAAEESKAQKGKHLFKVNLGFVPKWEGGCPGSRSGRPGVGVTSPVWQDRCPASQGAAV